MNTDSQKKTAKELVLTRVANDHNLQSQTNFEFGLKHALSDHGLPVVCCLVRDGAYWLPAFLDHYRRLGVKEFFFLDNGSIDQTLTILRTEKGVGVYSIHKSFFKEFNTNLRRVLIRMVRPRGWVLGVDCDELFDYSWSNVVSLPRLCAYLDHYEFNGMTTHMLDMFPEGSIDDLLEEENVDPRIAQSFYSLQGLKVIDYEQLRSEFEGYPLNVLNVPYDTWRFYCDGIRFVKFSSRLWLTKHALFKMDGAANTISPPTSASLYQNC